MLSIDDLDHTFFLRLLTVVLIGALVGVERERGSNRNRFGGIRTFILIAVIGAISAWMSALLESPALFVVGALTVGGLILGSYLMASRKSEDFIGLTTEFAAMVVFFLGGAAMLGQEEVAVVLAILTTATLTFKQDLHHMVDTLGRDDIIAGLKLLFSTFIVLPLLPNTPVDPWGALNLYKLWWLVILISTLSLIGYAAIRWLGERRGMLLTGVFGGLVSSTAVTLSFAKQSRLREKEGSSGSSDSLAAGILVAWGIMFVRVIIEVAVVNPALLRSLLAPMSVLGVLCLILVGWLMRSGPSGAAVDKPDVPLRNPFSLWEATKFGLVFAVVLLIVRLALQYMPSSWMYGVAVLAGSTDVDAITLSVAQESLGALPLEVASQSILLAVLSNTLIKCGMVIGLGSRGLRRRIALITLLLVVTGALMFFGKASGII
ncbi:MAG: uncharacterized membrane protein (DUF4010 family) [Myxococcota bacterium]